jgi:hypothetical protein
MNGLNQAKFIKFRPFHWHNDDSTSEMAAWNPCAHGNLVAKYKCETAANANQSGQTANAAR